MERLVKNKDLIAREKIQENLDKIYELSLETNDILNKIKNEKHEDLARGRFVDIIINLHHGWHF